MNKNIGFMLQFADRTEEKLTDGSLENWTAGVLDSWSKVENGSSTVNEETADLRPGSTGSKCCRIDIDASSNNAYIYQDVTLIKNAFYYLKIYYKIVGDNSVNPELMLYDTGSNVFLKNDGTWGDNTDLVRLPNQPTWTFIEFRFRAHADYTAYRLRLVRENALVSCSIYIDDVQLVLDTSFVAFEDVFIDAAQYLPHLLNPVSISQNLALRGEFESSGFDLEIDDPAGNYRAILDNPDTQGVGALAIAVDTSGVVICERVIIGISYETGKIKIQAGDGYEELTGNLPIPKISRKIWPGAPETSLEQYIPHFNGSFLVSAAADKGSINFIKAYRVQDKGANPGKYLIGKCDPIYYPPEYMQYCIDPAGNDITASCTFESWFTNGTNYNYCLLDIAVSDVEYILVHFYNDVTAPEYLLYPVENWFFKKFSIDFTSLENCLLDLDYRHYKIIGYTEYPGGLFDYDEYNEAHLLIDQQTTILEILRKYCQAYGLSFYIDAARQLIFYVQDFEKTATSATYEIQSGISEAFTISNLNEAVNEMCNQINFSWGYTDGSLNRAALFDHAESQRINGSVQTADIEADVFSDVYDDSKEFAYTTAKQRFLESFYPQMTFSALIPDLTKTINTSGDTIDDILNPFAILKFSHPVFRSTTARYCQVRRVTRNYPENSASVDFIDVSHTRLLDFEAIMLLQSNDEDGSTEFYDEAPRGYCYFTPTDVEHSADFPQFGKSSMKFNGTSSNLVFNDSKRDFRFQLFRNIATGLSANSVEFSCRVYFNALGATEVIVGSYADANNYWYIRKRTNDKIHVNFVSGGVSAFSLTSANTITADAWHHIVFYRTDAAAGLYIDEVQVAYSASVINLYFNDPVPVIIGCQNSTDYLDGYLQGIRTSINGAYDSARNTGMYDLNPDVGLTDAYTVPTGLHSVFYQRYWIPELT